MAKVLVRAALAVSLLFAGPSLLCSQSFSGGIAGLGGMMKSTAKIHRKLPAVFVLPGNEVSVKVTASAPGSNTLPTNLSPLLETTLQHYDTHIVIENAKPQVLISCVITGYVPPRIQNLVHPGTAAGKNIFGKQQAAQPGQPYTKVNGELTVSYRAQDLKSRRTLDAAVLETKINAEYEANSNSKLSSIKIPFGKKDPTTSGKEADPAPASTEEVNERLLKAIAKDVARRVVNTDETIEVLLAKGKLEPAAKLAQSGLWSRMLEQLESMTPFEKPEDDAYRLYDLGVAYEAMGYSAPDPKQGFKFFEQAAIDYGKALDANPGEKYFREPQNRIQTALLITKTLSERPGTGAPVENVSAKVKRNQAETPEPKRVESARPSESANAQDAGADSEVLTNQGVIELAKSGMNDENLIANIKDAKEVDFDLSLSGQKQLMQSGVSNAVLSAMRTRGKHPASKISSTVSSHHQ